MYHKKLKVHRKEKMQPIRYIRRLRSAYGFPDYYLYPKFEQLRPHNLFWSFLCLPNAKISPEGEKEKDIIVWACSYSNFN